MFLLLRAFIIHFKSLPDGGIVAYDSASSLGRKRYY